MSQYFLETYEMFSGNVKIKLDLPNYAKKAYLKGATGIGTSVLVHWSPKHSMIHTNNVLRRRLKMLTEKIPNASGLVKKTDNNTKIIKIEN